MKDLEVWQAETGDELIRIGTPLNAYISAIT